MGQFAHWRINLVTSGCFNGIITINTVDALVSWQNYRLLPLLRSLFGEEEPPICTPCCYCSTTRYRFFVWGPTFFISEKRTIFNNSSGWLQLISLFGSKSGDGHRKQSEDWYISNCPYNSPGPSGNPARQRPRRPVRVISEFDSPDGFKPQVENKIYIILPVSENQQTMLKKPWFSHHLQSGQPILRKERLQVTIWKILSEMEVEPPQKLVKLLTLWGAFFAWRAPILSWLRIMCSQVCMLIFLELSQEML